jgi:hypothetical protein
MEKPKAAACKKAPSGSSAYMIGKAQLKKRKHLGRTPFTGKFVRRYD